MHRLLAVVLAFLLVGALIPGIAAASEVRAGGSITVGADERVDDLTVMGGTVAIHGTVDGDVTVMGGNVIITGTVTGDVEVVAGNLYVDGPIGGSASVIGGNVEFGEAAAVGASVSAVAGTVSVAGAIDGDLRAVSGSVTLLDGSSVGGDVRYTGELDQRQGATVHGAIDREPYRPLPPIDGVTAPAPWIVSVYLFMVNFLLGAIILLAAPAGVRTVADTARSGPVISLVAGIFLLLAIPVALVLVAITIIGLPLALLGFLLFGLTVWIALIVGRYAVGAWLLSLVGRDNRWAALAIGLALVGFLAWLPYVGRAISAVVTLIGLGAMTVALLNRGE